MNISIIAAINDPEMWHDTVVKYKDLANDPQALEFLAYTPKTDWGIAETYNEGIEDANKESLRIFTHQDAYPLEESWDTKLLKFSDNRRIGIIGFAGSTAVPISGMWWSHGEKYGGLSQGGSPLTFQKPPAQVRIIDGFCFAVTSDVTELKKFDTSYGGFHFYDLDYCLQCHKQVWVADIMMEHMSHGNINDDWKKARDIFKKKWHY